MEEEEAATICCISVSLATTRQPSNDRNYYHDCLSLDEAGMFCHRTVSEMGVSTQQHI